MPKTRNGRGLVGRPPCWGLGLTCEPLKLSGILRLHNAVRNAVSQLPKPPLSLLCLLGSIRLPLRLHGFAPLLLCVTVGAVAPHVLISLYLPAGAAWPGLGM